MRLRFTVADQNFPSLLEKLNTWNASITSKDENGSQISAVRLSFPFFNFFLDIDVSNKIWYVVIKQLQLN